MTYNPYYPRHPFFQDPAASVKFYEERFGMKLVDVYHSPTLGKSNYYLASIREGEKWPEPGTAQASNVSSCQIEAFDPMTS